MRVIFLNFPRNLNLHSLSRRGSKERKLFLIFCIYNKYCPITTRPLFGSTVERREVLFINSSLSLPTYFLHGNYVHSCFPDLFHYFFHSSRFQHGFTFHVARVIFVSLVLFRPSSLNLSSFSLCSPFVTISFLLCGVVSHTPKPQPGGPGYNTYSFV